MSSFTLTRSLLVVLVPGIVAVAPWLLLAVNAIPDVSLLYRTYPVFFQALVLSVVIVVGTVCEGLGSRVEVQWDKGREREFSIEANWWTYLARSVEHEPVGFRYIARHAATLSFELSMGFATALFSCGVIGLLLQSHAPVLWAPLIALLGAGAVFVFGRSAYDTHELLCETRLEVNRRMGGLLGPVPAKFDASDTCSHAK